jgi:uncharacterized protein (TIGR02145 family)
MKFKYSFTVLFLTTTWCVQSQYLREKLSTLGASVHSIHSSAVFELESNSKGFLPPRMTLTQRDQINNPALGLIVWCTNCGINGELQVYNGMNWTNFSGGATALNILAFVPTNNGGYLRFMKHNLGADTSADPLTPSWKLNGAYFQWGIRPLDTNNDNFKTKPYNVFEGFVAAPTGPGNIGANSDTQSNWTVSLAPSTSWYLGTGTPIKTTEDPCPTGFRVPTSNEWISIHSTTPINTTLNWSNVGGSSWPTNVSSYDEFYNTGKLISNSLYLPAAGYFDYTQKKIIDRGISGAYWSATFASSNFAYCLIFTSSSLNPTGGRRISDSLSVRCISE